MLSKEDKLELAEMRLVDAQDYWKTEGASTLPLYGPRSIKTKEEMLDYLKKHDPDGFGDSEKQSSSTPLLDGISMSSGRRK